MNRERPQNIRVGGIEIAVWSNDNGSKAVTIQRNYKDKKGNWGKTNFLQVNDIPKAILGLQKAYEEIVLTKD